MKKGVISVTCDVDTTQLGQYSVEAVTSYIEDGRTNSFYNVDINFLDRTAVKKMRRRQSQMKKIRWSGELIRNKGCNPNNKSKNTKFRFCHKLNATCILAFFIHFISF